MSDLKYSSLQRSFQVNIPLGQYIVEIWGKPPEHREMISVDGQYNELYDYFQSKNIHLNVLKQTHGKEVISIGNGITGQIPEGDALITDKENEALCIKTADCIPSFFYSEKDIFMGAVHSGWKGLQLNILKETLKKAFKQKSGLKMENLKFIVGPHIRAENYETREDVFSRFPDDCSYKISDNQKLLDMEKILKNEFQDLNIGNERITWINENTFESKSFFSHRNGETGRNFNIIYFKKL